MANLSTSHAGHAAGLANREGWEVVMQHEVLFLLALEVLETLHVVGGSQSGRNKRLCFTAGKDCGTMRARKHTGFDCDIANLVKLAAIGTNAIFRYLLAEQTLAQHLVIVLKLFGRGFITLWQL